MIFMIKQIKRVLIHFILRPIFIRFGISKFSKQGLNDLDDKLAPFLDFNDGFFVELGANDGISQSNTFYLEKIKGWRGVLVEPIPRLYEQAKRNRRASQVFNAACVPFDYDKPYIEITDLNLMSFVEGALTTKDKEKQLEKGIQLGQGTQLGQVIETVKIKARTLNNILRACHVTHIDFLSLDVEGFESSVLKGLDLIEFKPTYILIEARYRHDVEVIISPYYEVVSKLTYHDVLYKRSR